MSEDLEEIERRIRDLNEAIAQFGASIRETRESMREFGYGIHPETDPQHVIAVFKW